MEQEEFDKFDKNSIIRYKYVSNGAEALLINNEENAKIEGIKKANAEDIIVFLIRGKTL